MKAILQVNVVTILKMLSIVAFITMSGCKKKEKDCWMCYYDASLNPYTLEGEHCGSHPGTDANGLQLYCEMTKH